MKSMSEILRELRTSKSMTQSDIAKILGLTTNAYQSYERGTSEPGCKALNKLANFYGVSTDYLLGRTMVKQMATEQPDPLAGIDISNVEKRIIEKYTALDEDMRAVCIETFRQLSTALDVNPQKLRSVQSNAQTDSKQVQNKNTYTCGELEEFQKQQDYEQGAG